MLDEIRVYKARHSSGLYLGGGGWMGPKLTERGVTKKYAHAFNQMLNSLEYQQNISRSEFTIEEHIYVWSAVNEHEV